MNTTVGSEALWQCDACGAWWCSQTTVEPTTFLLDISRDLLDELGWENFRGWRLGGTPHVATCGECDALSPAPLLGDAPVSGQLRVPLTDLLHPQKKKVAQPVA